MVSTPKARGKDTECPCRGDTLPDEEKQRALTPGLPNPGAGACGPVHGQCSLLLLVWQVGACSKHFQVPPPAPHTHSLLPRLSFRALLQPLHSLGKVCLTPGVKQGPTPALSASLLLRGAPSFHEPEHVPILDQPLLKDRAPSPFPHPLPAQ